MWDTHRTSTAWRSARTGSGRKLHCHVCIGCTNHARSADSEPHHERQRREPCESESLTARGLRLLSGAAGHNCLPPLRLAHGREALRRE